MESLREIVTAYYERSNDNEKETAEEFFRKLDLNSDGKVSLTELKKSVGARLSNELIFRQLDESGDGTLDFYKVLAVYYMVKLLVCSGCCELLDGPYFTCLLCLGKGNDTFDLCCSLSLRKCFS
ncbi:hypothetical protein CDL12_26516 [Handroanthus impetiginosus]|uniref:EF-hand domain-containing protein n=1 Tax=Handroanthus impetiginosus TaxID=429701 RepID=A0A2G9G6P4_9LAMI|nr:hypothetical protein CDL12_26516 [Handroanthus impetiginosus]